MVRTPVALDAEVLYARALRYLDRFDASAEQLRRVLRRGIRRVRLDPETQTRLDLAVDEIVARLVGSAVIDDRRYAETLARGLRQRGASAVAIAHKLRARGIADMTATVALREVDGDATSPELAAALAFVRRRRLGRHRPEAERRAHAARDLAALARAGFSYEIARRALDLKGEDDDF